MSWSFMIAERGAQSEAGMMAESFRSQGTSHPHYGQRKPSFQYVPQGESPELIRTELLLTWDSTRPTLSLATGGIYFTTVIFKSGHRQTTANNLNTDIFAIGSSSHF